MIAIVRIQTQEKPEHLWNEILRRRDELQAALNGKGRLLYLSKRVNYKEASLFIHVADTNVLGDFISNHLAKIPGVDALWLVNFLKPVFFPVPEPRRSGKRFTVTIKTYAPKLNEIYVTLAELKVPPEIQMGYVAYTFHLFGDALQVSLAADDETTLRKYVQETIDTIPGVLGTTVCEIEKTHPFVSYEEWQKYAAQHPIMTDWDERLMVAQFSAIGAVPEDRSASGVRPASGGQK